MTVNLLFSAFSKALNWLSFSRGRPAGGSSLMSTCRFTACSEPMG